MMGCRDLMHHKRTSGQLRQKEETESGNGAKDLEVSNIYIYHSCFRSSFAHKLFTQHFHTDLLTSAVILANRSGGIFPHSTFFLKFGFFASLRFDILLRTLFLYFMSVFLISWYIGTWPLRKKDCYKDNIFFVLPNSKFLNFLNNSRKCFPI